MNTLKSYIKEGLFNPDSVEDQIDNQYYLSLLNELKKNNINSVFEFVSKNITNNNLFKLENNELYINLDLVNRINITNQLLILIENYFNKFKKVNFIQNNNELNLFIEEQIWDKSKVELINDFFKDIIFNNFYFNQKIENLSINVGVKNKITPTINIFAYSADIKNITINIVKLNTNENFYFYISTPFLNNLKNINFTFANTNIKNKFIKTKKIVHLSYINEADRIEDLIRKYRTFSRTQNKNKLEEVIDDLNNRIHEIINNIDIFNEYSIIKLKLAGMRKIAISVKKDKLLVDYLFKDKPIDIYPTIELPY